MEFRKVFFLDLDPRSCSLEVRLEFRVRHSNMFGEQAKENLKDGFICYTLFAVYLQ